MIYLGIDPGLDGGIAIITPDEVVATVMPTIDGPRGKRELHMPDVERWCRGANHAAIEKAQVMPKQGVVSCGRIMLNYGKLCGLLFGLKVPFVEIHPKSWQKVFGVSSKNGGTKASSVQVAQQLFPGVDLLPTPRCKKPHDGMSDALLIAEWCSRISH